MTTEAPYTYSLLDWGRSGSFYPFLTPDADSLQDLELTQSQIAKQSPSSELSQNIHATLFYAKPLQLYERLLQIDPLYREVDLYLELQAVMATLITSGHLYPFEAEVTGLGRLGPNNEVTTLKLADMAIRSDARELLRRNLGYSGFAASVLDALAEEPEYQWLFGPSDMHISLAIGVQDLNIDRLTLPSVVRFSGLGDGSVQAPGETVEDRKRWYLMGI